MSKEDDSRSAAVLGAAGGIGSALVKQLAAGGWKLTVGGRSGDALEALAAEVGGRAVVTDGRRFDEVERFLETANRDDDLAAVVNCAGSVILKPAHLTSQTDFEETIATNLTTSFAVVRAAAKQLRKRGGSVVLMASAVAEIGLANHEAIAAAKAGVAGLARSAAATYSARDIRFNAVAPGLVATPATGRLVENERALEASLRLHPLGRVGQPAEIARLIAWLLDPQNSWITGQVIALDGGLSSLKVSK